MIGKAIILSIILVGCMETDAKVAQLESEKEQLQNEVLTLVDSIDTIMENKTIEIDSLNKVIQMRSDSFDSLMVLWNNELSDTTYLDTLRNRLVRILNE